MRLSNKVAVITGAGRGIGKQMAIAFAREGADVVLAARHREPLEEVAAEIEQLGRRALAVPTDVSDLVQVDALADAAEAEFGRIDVWVSNAGGYSFFPGGIGPLIDLPLESWEGILRLNLTSPVVAAQKVAPMMIKQGGGSILNMTSIDAQLPAPNAAAYGAAKAALEYVTSVMAIELGQYNIRVNAIAPNLVDTPLVARHLSDPAKRALSEALHPIGRVGTTDDIAAAAVFLVSDEASWITGETLLMAGGARVTIDMYKYLLEATAKAEGRDPQ